MSKPINNSTKAKLENKNDTLLKNNILNKTEALKADQSILLEEYYSVHTRQYHPLTKKFIERESERLVNWANQEESLVIQDFWDASGYSRKNFYRWIQQFPEFESAHEYAMSRIGSRRELGAINRKYAESTIHRTLGAYNHIWKEQTRELAKLKEEIAPQNQAQIVVIERFPELSPVSTKSPEEVAMTVHKATGDDRKYGPSGRRDIFV